MAENNPDSTAPVYENTNGMPLCEGKNLHMEVGLKIFYLQLWGLNAFK
jgi:hypothetical protein